MIVTTKDTNKTYAISLRVWTGNKFSPDLADDLFAPDVVNGLISQDWLDDVQEDVLLFNAGKPISWYEHSSYAQFISLDIKEVQE